MQRLGEGSGAGRSGVRALLPSSWRGRVLAAALLLLVVELVLAPFGWSLPHPLWLAVKLVLGLYALWAV